jgi:hypothetical protein
MSEKVCSVCQVALIWTPGGLACQNGLHVQERGLLEVLSEPIPLQVTHLVEFFYVTYRFPLLTGDKVHEAGPYETKWEAQIHYSDIFGYGGVEQVEIVGRYAPSTKSYNGEDMIG